MSEPIGTERYFTPIPQRPDYGYAGMIQSVLLDCRTDLMHKVEGLGRVPVALPEIRIEYDGVTVTAHMDVMTRRKRWYE